jgi:hypothetical protein
MADGTSRSEGRKGIVHVHAWIEAGLLAEVHPGVRGFDSRSRRCVQTQTTEVTRPDEDTVLKTDAVQTVVGSIPTASARKSISTDNLGAFPHGRL